MAATRRLAAILAADVAGYSRLMGADEEGTLECLEALRRGHHGLTRCQACVRPLHLGPRRARLRRVLAFARHND
jgi:hypothetical protein